MYRQPVFNFFAGSNVNIFQNTAVQDNTLQNPEKIGSSKRKRCSYLLFIQATKNKNIEAFLSLSSILWSIRLLLNTLFLTLE